MKQIKQEIMEEFDKEYCYKSFPNSDYDWKCLPKNVKQFLSQAIDKAVKKALEGELEQLAEIEHKQWMSWTKYIFKEFGELAKENKSDQFVLDFLINKLAKWQDNWKPYKNLKKEEKEKDRVWAREVIKHLQDIEEKRKEIK